MRVRLLVAQDARAVRVPLANLVSAIDIDDRDTSLPLSYRDVCDPPHASPKPSDLPDADTFILDHKASMDPCTDPAVRPAGH